MSIHELIERAFQGDASARASLTKTLAPLFTKEARVAVSRVRGTAEDVNELVNDIFANLFSDGARALKRFNPAKHATPDGYFRYFAHLRCIAYVRDERNRTLERLLEPGDVNEFSISEDPEYSHIQELDSLAKLQRIKELLTSTEYEVFERRYLKSQEAAQICTAMGFSRDVYFQRVHRLVDRLRQHGFLNHRA